MFTGIIEEVGKVLSVRKGATSCMLTIAASVVLEQTQVGDSIAVNGVCLTVTQLSSAHFCADVMPETLTRSSLGNLTTGSPVNLERALTPTTRMGGHIVSGHIDCTGTIKRIVQDDNALRYTIKAPASALKYIVEKGSIAIQGISLTVTNVGATNFEVSVIPHTQTQTTLLLCQVGDTVNLECDILGKYVERLLQFDGAQVTPSPNSEKLTTSNLSEEYLRSMGF